MSDGRDPEISVEASPSPTLVPGLALATFVNMVSTLALSPFLPLVADQLETNVALLGQIPSLTMLLAAILGLMAGPLADHFGYRRSLTIGLATSAVSSLGLALAPTLLPLFIAGLFGAVGRAVVMPTAQALIGSSVGDEKRRREAISWVATGTTAAPLLGIPVLTALAGFSHWRFSFVLVGSLAAIMAAVLWWTLAADRPRAGATLRLRDVIRAYAPLRRHRPTLTLILGSLIVNVGTWATFTYMSAFFVQVHEFTTQQVGGTYLVVGIGTVIGSKLVGGWLGQHPRMLLIGGRLLGGVGVLIALAAPIPALAALVLLAAAAMMSTMSMASTTVLLLADPPAGRATTLTLHASALSLGTALGAAVGGLILTFADYRTLGVVSMLFFSISAMVIWLHYVRAIPLVTTPGVQSA